MPGLLSRRMELAFFFLPILEISSVPSEEAGCHVARLHSSLVFSHSPKSPDLLCSACMFHPSAQEDGGPEQALSEMARCAEETGQAEESLTTEAGWHHGDPSRAPWCGRRPSPNLLWVSGVAPHLRLEGRAEPPIWRLCHPVHVEQVPVSSSHSEELRPKGDVARPQAASRDPHLTEPGLGF